MNKKRTGRYVEINPKDCLKTEISGTSLDMSHQIVLAEDDVAIRELLLHHIEREGYTPISAQDGHQALRAIRSGVTLALIDVGLPGIDGFEIARTLHREKNLTPIIFITARVEEVDRIIGFELGADDYISKPFSPREVLARVRAVTRRSGHAPEAEAGCRRFGRLEIDLLGREARVDGRDIGLKPREFALLAMFVQNHGVALSRNTLIERVWGFDFDGDPRTIDVHVRRLRSKLHEEYALPESIHTVHGYGYKFAMNTQT
jgi:DNA-binding response OmpR family regulator